MFACVLLPTMPQDKTHPSYNSEKFPSQSMISQGDNPPGAALKAFSIIRNVFFPFPQWKIRFNHALSESR